MSQTAINYVTLTSAGGWRVAGSRVSLDSVVYAHLEGLTPEAIVEEFPSLSAEQVYGAIAHYLHNKADVDAYLAEQQKKWELLAEESHHQMGPRIEQMRRRFAEMLAAESGRDATAASHLE